MAYVRITCAHRSETDLYFQLWYNENVMQSFFCSHGLHLKSMHMCSYDAKKKKPRSRLLKGGLNPWIFHQEVEGHRQFHKRQKAPCTVNKPRHKAGIIYGGQEVKLKDTLYFGWQIVITSLMESNFYLQCHCVHFECAYIINQVQSWLNVLLHCADFTRTCFVQVNWTALSCPVADPGTSGKIQSMGKKERKNEKRELCLVQWKWVEYPYMQPPWQHLESVRELSGLQIWHLTPT